MKSCSASCENQAINGRVRQPCCAADWKAVYLEISFARLQVLKWNGSRIEQAFDQLAHERLAASVGKPGGERAEVMAHRAPRVCLGVLHELLNVECQICSFYQNLHSCANLCGHSRGTQLGGDVFENQCEVSGSAVFDSGCHCGDRDTEVCEARSVVLVLKLREGGFGGGPSLIDVWCAHFEVCGLQLKGGHDTFEHSAATEHCQVE